MQPQGTRVVTPEAVVLDVRTAGLGSRALARTIDGLIQAAALITLSTVGSVVSVSAGVGGSTIAAVIFLIFGTAIVFAYPIVFESLWRGRTPGKAALGLRVVTVQGAPIRFRHALVRGLIGIVELTPPLLVIGVISLLVSSKDQRLGDMAAGTIVLRERAPARRSIPVAFYPPPGWESFVASLDVSAMTPAEYEMARSFLLRVPEMTPAARSSLAAQLASPLVTRWHQPVPPGAGPELWLACVVSAYQRLHAPPVPVSPYGPAPSGGAYGNGAWGAPNPMAQQGGPWAPPTQFPPGWGMPGWGTAPAPPSQFPPGWGMPGWGTAPAPSPQAWSSPPPPPPTGWPQPPPSPLPAPSQWSPALPPSPAPPGWPQPPAPQGSPGWGTPQPQPQPQPQPPPSAPLPGTPAPPPPATVTPGPVNGGFAPPG